MKNNGIFPVIIVLVIIISVVFALIIYNKIDLIGNSHGPYEVTIEKNYHNESEEELISIAENITPPDGSWWFREFDNILIADCINKEAIKYYTNLINEIEEDHDFTGFDIKNAYFKYNATIGYITNVGNNNTNDQNLIKVNLTIRFHEYVNSINALWFEHYRCVVFNTDREIITVFGDDIEPDIIVS
jgi:hypothetical protein